MNVILHAVPLGRPDSVNVTVYVVGVDCAKLAVTLPGPFTVSVVEALALEPGDREEEEVLQELKV